MKNAIWTTRRRPPRSSPVLPSLHVVHAMATVDSIYNVTVDDNSIALQYSGDWTVFQDSQSTSQDCFYNGTSRIGRNGSAVTLDFSGVAVYVFGYADTVTIALDGRRFTLDDGIVDTNSTPRVACEGSPSSMLFAQRGLTNEHHQITLIAPSAGPNTVEIDRVIYTVEQTTSSAHSVSPAVIGGALGGAIALFLLLVCSWWAFRRYRRRRRRRRRADEEQEDVTESQPSKAEERTSKPIAESPTVPQLPKGPTSTSSPQRREAQLDLPPVYSPSPVPA